MGYGDLSIMGNTKIETPNLDKLAREGVLMTKFYDAAPICSSSRAGFMSGHFPATVNFVGITARSEEHTSELQSLMRTSYAVFCLKKKKKAHAENSYELKP